MGRLGAITSTIQAKKHSSAIQEKRGPQRQTCPRETAWLPDVSAGFWPFQRKAFPGQGIILFHAPDLHLYNAYALQCFLDSDII